MIKRVRILIADDHPVYRQGLKSVFRSESEFKVVGEAADGEQALKLTKDLRPDVLLLDLVMPRLSGLDTLRELAKAPTPVRVVVLTASIEKEQIAQALQLGAHGVVLKDASNEVLLASIRCAVSGDFWVRDQRVGDLMEVLRKYVPAGDGKDAAKVYGLTPRELDVVQSIVSGLTNKEIAARFSISQQTVKHHLSHIFDKLGVSNRLELALFAINHQLC